MPFQSIGFPITVSVEQYSGNSTKEYTTFASPVQSSRNENWEWIV